MNLIILNYFITHIMHLPTLTISLYCLWSTAKSLYNFWNFIRLSHSHWPQLHRMLCSPNLRPCLLIRISRTEILTCSNASLIWLHLSEAGYFWLGYQLTHSRRRHSKSTFPQCHRPRTGSDRNPLAFSGRKFYALRIWFVFCLTRLF